MQLCVLVWYNVEELHVNRLSTEHMVLQGDATKIFRRWSILKWAFKNWYLVDLFLGGWESIVVGAM